MIIEKGECEECGRKLIDWDMNYSNGKIKLCRKCFEKYKINHHVIVKYCPGFVDNGNDYEFYLWEGYEQFLKDNPLENGWEYRLSQNKYISHIMINAQFKTEWWVIWNVYDAEIIKEIRKKIPPMKYPKGD